jgi:hypothetical protein
MSDDNTVHKISSCSAHGDLRGDIHGTIDTLHTSCSISCANDFWMLLPQNTIKEITCQKCKQLLNLV